MSPHLASHRSSLFLIFVSALVLAASSPAAMASRRSISVADQGLEILLWTEPGPQGATRSFYAFERDGRPLGRVRETTNQIRLADYRWDPLADAAPAVPESLRARPSNRLYLVQLVATALPELQQLVRQAGGTIHRYYTDHTLLVEMDGAARAAVERLPFVRWIGPYEPAFRTERVLREALAGVGEPLGTQRYSIMVLERGPDRKAEVAQAIRALGGTIDIMSPEGFRLEATLDENALVELLHDNRVHYVDRWGGPGGLDMDNVRIVGGADYVETQGGFTGLGVNGEIFDTEILTTHQEWCFTPIIHSVNHTSSSFHGTSVMSNVFACGTNPPARGMAPDGQGIFFLYSECDQFGGSTSRYTIAQELLDPLGPYRAVFQTSSVGNSQVLNYTTISAEMDDVLLLHQLIHTQSQSNTGSQLSRPQAWAKNIVSVGGIVHSNNTDRDDDFWGGGASIGPAADGRIKPDLAFYYDSIFSATGTGSSSYTQFGGTSSATPQTAGHFAIFHQMWHEGVFPGHGGDATVFDSRPQMMTAKAMLVNTAHRYDWNNPPPPGSNADLDRFKQGWGTADLRNLYDDAPLIRVLDESVVLEPLDTYSTTVALDGTEEELRVTMTYVDPMGTPGAGQDRINDLSLRVTSPSSTVYWGNNGLAADNVSTSGGVSNDLDTVENVFVTNPEAGTWTVEVLADEVVEDAHLETPAVDADFALVIFPDANQAIFTDGFESGDTSGWDTTVN